MKLLFGQFGDFSGKSYLSSTIRAKLLTDAINPVALEFGKK